MRPRAAVTLTTTCVLALLVVLAATWITVAEAVVSEKCP